MDFERDLVYRMNTLCSMMETVEYETAIRECVLIETNSYTSKNIMALHEDFKEAIKNFFESIPGLIENAWNKFLQLFNMKYAKDAEYLKKNTEILDKECKLDKIAVYEYKTDMLKNSDLPNIIYDSIKDKLDDQTTAEKALFPNFVDKNEKLSFSDSVKFILRGSPSTENKPEFSGKDFGPKLKDCAKFVEGYTEIIKNIKNDKKKLLTQVKSFKNLVQQKQSEESTQLAVRGESFYSQVFDTTLILEEDKYVDAEWKEVKDDKQKTVTDDKTKQEKTADNIMKSATDKVKKGSSEYITACKRTRMAIKITTQFFSAKLSIANEIYKTYMEILRAHISSYVTEDKKKEGKKENSDNNENEDQLTSEEEANGKELVNEVIDKDGNPKDMDEADKANFFNKLSKAFNGKTGKAKKVFNKIFSKKDK